MCQIKGISEAKMEKIKVRLWVLWRVLVTRPVTHKNEL